MTDYRAVRTTVHKGSPSRPPGGRQIGRRGLISASPNKPRRPALSLLVVLISLLVLLIWFAMLSRLPALRNWRATLWPPRAIWPGAMRTARTMPPVIRSRSCAGTIMTARPVRTIAAGFVTGKGTTRTTRPMPNSFLVRSVLLPV
jgi:hypothetical protein